MKRSDFFRKLGIGLGVAVVAPRVFADKSIKDENTEMMDWAKSSFKVRYIEPRKMYPLTPDECYPSYYNIGDEFWRNGEKFMCVAIFPFSNESHILTLRPFDAGDDIQVDSDNLGYFHFTGKTYWMNKEA